MKRLPEAEFEVMCALWDTTEPATTSQLMKRLGNAKGWVTPALISLLNRLAERGFVRSEKRGRERLYYSLVGREEYLSFETSDFLRRYHGNSLKSLVASLMGDADRPLCEEDIAALTSLLNIREDDDADKA